MKRIDRLAEILREAKPTLFIGNTEDIASFCMYLMTQKYGVEEWVDIPGYEYEEPTIEYLEKAYEMGYAAIIHDGKFLGFRKEKVL